MIKERMVPRFLWCFSIILFLLVNYAWIENKTSHALKTPQIMLHSVLDAQPELIADQNHTLYLPIIQSPPLEPPYDMALFMIGDGRLYEVWHSNDSQARHQTQIENDLFYHTKGDEYSAEWEELWATDDTIYRGVDTSSGDGTFYILRDESNQVGSAWSPRFWDVGDLYERQPLVTFYQKADCAVLVNGYQHSWLRFEAYYPTYTFDSGITLANVIELAWLLEPDSTPIETYFYAINHGLVAWTNNDRGFSYISEIHAPGQRPDNTREYIPCLQSVRQVSPITLGSILEPLPPPYRAK